MDNEWWSFHVVNSSDVTGCGGLTGPMAIIMSEETPPRKFLRIFISFIDDGFIVLFFAFFFSFIDVLLILQYCFRRYYW